MLLVVICIVLAVGFVSGLSVGVVVTDDLWRNGTRLDDRSVRQFDQWRDALR